MLYNPKRRHGSRFGTDGFLSVAEEKGDTLILRVKATGR